MDKTPTPPPKQNTENLTPLQEKMFEELDALLSETSNVSQGSETTDISQTSETSNVSQGSETTDIRQTNETSNVSQGSETTDIRQTCETSNVSQGSETTDIHQTSETADATQARETDDTTNATTSSTEKRVHRAKTSKKPKVKKTPLPASATRETKQLRLEYESELDEKTVGESFSKSEEIYVKEAIPPLMLESLSQKDVAKEEKRRLEGHRQRVRTLFDATQFKGWPQHHILEMLLFYTLDRVDTKELARRLIEHFHTFQGVCDAPIESLMRIDGVGIETARFIKMIPAVASVYVDNCETIDVKITSSKQAIRFLLPYFVDATNEKTVILCTDIQQRYAGISVVGEGGKSSTPFDIRRILETAYAKQAHYIYLAHNHVNASLTPSLADWATTKHAVEVLKAIEIYVEDHFVFSKSRAVSMYDLSKAQNRNIPW